MTVSVSKPALNLREELSALKKPSGPKGEELLRTNNISEVYTSINPVMFRNRIINGDFRFSQRGTYTSATTISGGTILQQGFASSGYNDRLVLNDNEATGNFQVGRSSMGTASDILTIEIACTTSNKTAIAVMNWIEQR